MDGASAVLDAREPLSLGFDIGSVDFGVEAVDAAKWEPDRLGRCTKSDDAMAQRLWHRVTADRAATGLGP